MFGRKSPKSYRRSSQRPPSGCGVILLVAVASCILLALNGFFIAGIYSSLGSDLPPVLRNPKIMQTIVFVGPIILLVIEWRLTQALLHYLDDLFHGKRET